MPNLTARTERRNTDGSGADPQQIPLDDRTLTVTTPNGTDYVIGLSEDGHLQVWAPRGGNLLSCNAAGNVLNVVHWPHFQPMVPPTADQPVIASRKHIIHTVGGTGGMGKDALEAAQREIDADPDIKRLIEAAITRSVTTQEGGYGAGTAIPRRSATS